MRRALRTILSTILLIAAHASAQPVVNISCKATHTVGCEGAACSSERPEEGDDIYVGFELSTVSGRGNLCTYTYCRDFVLVPLPGDSLDEALKKLSGFTLSEKRGSTGDDLERPAIDYQLSVSEDRGRFFLGNLVGGAYDRVRCLRSPDSQTASSFARGERKSSSSSSKAMHATCEDARA